MNIRRLLLTASGAALMLAVPGTAALASAQGHPGHPHLAAKASSSPVPAPYPGAVPAPNPGANAVLPAPPLGTSSGAAPAAACTPYAAGDYAHPSSGDVSAHGWWYQNNCPNTKATVTVGLQEYFSDGVWRDKGTVGSASVYPGGGSANRASARDTCVGVAFAGWRSYVIVSIGNGASAYTAAQNFYCSVPYGSP
jgi:hypothetical protein